LFGGSKGESIHQNGIAKVKSLRAKAMAKAEEHNPFGTIFLTPIR
jgi:hypothetical protein